MHKVEATALIVSVLLAPFVLSAAQAIDAGCRAATPSDQAQRAARGIPETFQVCPGDVQALGIGQNFEQWYDRLKTQSPCNRNTCTLSCRTRNTGAQVCGPTATRWNSIGCHPNNRTAIFPTVSHGFAAHIELLRRYCGERGRCTIGSVVQQWTATVGDRPAYANFVSRNAGIPANQVYDPNDIDLVGRLALAMSCFEAGSMPYSAAELKQGLAMAAGGARVPVPANVGQLLEESLQGGYASNPGYSPNSSPGSWAYPPSSASQSNYRPPPPPPMQPLIQSPSRPEPKPDLPLTLPPTNNLGASGTNVPSALLIIAQSPRISRGGTALISWVSVGMKPDSCSVTQNGSLFARGNQGSKIFSSALTGSPGSARVVLSCVSISGSTLERDITITVL